MAYKLTHPKTGQEIERNAEDVPAFLRQGWEMKPGAHLPDAEQPQAAEVTVVDG